MSASSEDSQQISSRKELIEAMQARGKTYAFLARLLRVEVDADFYHDLHEMLFPVSSGDERIDTGYRMLATYLSNASGDVINGLAVDYMNTFLGHGVDGYSAAYPFESVYTSDRRLLMQGARESVLKFYRHFGVDKSKDWDDPEDHIAVELEFMQILIERTVAALEEKDMSQAVKLVEAQCEFSANHLANWVPMMTGDILKFAKTDFYRGVAYLLEGFVMSDYEFLLDIATEE